MRIFILTDSLSLPRKYSAGEVLWKNIYPNLLKEKFKDIEFIHVGMGAATIVDLYNQLNYYSNLKPDIVILQCGIVDCAPRSLGKIELEIIKKLHIFRLVKPFFKLFRKYRKISYTTHKEFEKHLKMFKERFNNAELWSIGILPGCIEYNNIVPGVSNQIEKYNATLAKNTFFIDVKNIPRTCIIEDFHHMNIEGHTYIYNLLANTISAKINKT